jgi:hypothetical protein
MGSGNGIIFQAFEELRNLVSIFKKGGKYNDCLSMVLVNGCCIYEGSKYDLFTNRVVSGKPGDQALLKDIEVIDSKDLYGCLKYFKNFGHILGNILKDQNFKRKSVVTLSLKHVLNSKTKGTLVKSNAVNFIKATIDETNLNSEMVKNFRDLMISVGINGNEFSQESLHNLNVKGNLYKNPTKNPLLTLMGDQISYKGYTNLLLT